MSEESIKGAGRMKSDNEVLNVEFGVILEPLIIVVLTLLSTSVRTGGRMLLGSIWILKDFSEKWDDCLSEKSVHPASIESNRRAVTT